MRTTSRSLWLMVGLGTIALALGACGGSDKPEGPLVPANQARAENAEPITWGQPFELAGLRITLSTPVKEDPPNPVHRLAPTWAFHTRVENISAEERYPPSFVVRCDNVPDAGQVWSENQIDRDILPSGSFVEAIQAVASPLDFPEGTPLECTNPTLFIETGERAADPKASAVLP
jgi:hypothetical protein